MNYLKKYLKFKMKKTITYKNNYRIICYEYNTFFGKRSYTIKEPCWYNPYFTFEMLEENK